MESALWAGKRMVNKPARIKLAVGLGEPSHNGAQGEFRYASKPVSPIRTRSRPASASRPRRRFRSNRR
jgi:hypothetical protein